MFLTSVLEHNVNSALYKYVLLLLSDILFYLRHIPGPGPFQFSCSRSCNPTRPVGLLIFNYS